MSYRIMCILNTGEIIDTESNIEPIVGSSLPIRGRNYTVTECHKSVVPEMWDWVISLVR